MTDPKIREFDNSIKDLADARRSLLTKLETTKVRLTYKHRMTSSAQDIVGFANIFKSAYLNKAKEAKESLELNANMDVHQLEKWWKENSENSMALSAELATCYKAMYFFIRALQDCCCAVLMELSGDKAGSYSSMNKNCLKKINSQIHKDIKKNIPAYFDWFQKQKETRNRIKEGVSYGTSFSNKDGLIINLHKIQFEDKPPTLDIEERLRIQEINDSINMSCQLMKFIETWEPIQK